MEKHKQKGIPRRNYIIARLRKSELNKLSTWLKNKDGLEVFVHERPNQVYIFKCQN